MIKSVASTVLKSISKVVFFIFLFFLAFYFFLLHGIKIDSVQTDEVNLSNVFIKLNQKLILSIDSVNVNKTDDNSSFDLKKIDEIIDTVLFGFTFFEEINIKDLKRDSDNFTLLYDSKHISIDSNRFFLSTTLDKNGSIIKCDIENFLYKDLNISSFGRATINLKNEYVDLLSLVNIDGVNIALKATTVGDKIKLFLTSKEFKSLKFLDKFVKFENGVDEWVYDRVKSKSLKLDYLTVDVYKKDFSVDLKSIDGVAILKDVNIKFNDKVEKVKAKGVNVSYKNEILRFDLIEPKFYEYDLNSSFVTIEHLEKDSYLWIYIKLNAPLNEKIHSILRGYNVNFNIHQLSSKTDGFVKVGVKLNNSDTNITGKFVTQNANFNLFNSKLFTKHADVTLDNSKIGVVAKESIFENFIKFDIDAFIDINKNSLTSNLFLHDLTLKSDEVEILSIKNQPTKLNIDFNKGVLVHVNSFDTTLNIDKNQTVIELSNLATLHEYSNLLQKYGVKEGRAKIITDDFKYFVINAQTFSKQNIFLKDNKAVELFNVDAKVGENFTKISMNEGAILIDVKKDKHLYIDSLDLNLSDVNLSDDKNSNSHESVFIETKNSNVTFKKLKILSSKLHASKVNGFLDVESYYKESVLKLLKKDDYLKLHGTNFDDKFLDTLLGVSLFRDGNYEILGFGNLSEIDGTLKMQNAKLDNIDFFANIFAFLDTIPGILNLSLPSFSVEGFLINDGFIEFLYSDNTVFIKNIKLIGESLNITGYGVVDIKNSTVDLKLKVAIMKNLSNIIDKIPILNYLVLGKDGNLELSIEVKGDLKNPKVSTAVLEDSIFAPINIIKRTIQFPFKIFESFK